MSVLGDSVLTGQVDTQDFLGVVERFPEQLAEARTIGDAAKGLPDPAGIRSVAVLGMGGSGISGDVLELSLAESPVFVKTCKGYELPAWVGPDTLVFAVSYSGNTEETLATFDQAIERGSRVVAVTTGGALADKCSSAGVPVVRIPPGLQPRAALGYLSVPLMVVAERLGLAQGLSAQLDEAVQLMKQRAAEYSRGVDAEANPAKQLAAELEGRIPIVYGSEGIAEVAAYRWKCQLNECAKVPAYHHVFPELNHNEIVGWNQLDDVSDSLALIVLRHDKEHPRIDRRVEVTLPLIQDHLGVVKEVRASGESTLARFFDLVYLGDFAATYLAISTGVDPGPVDVIESLKKKLAEG